MLEPARRRIAFCAGFNSAAFVLCGTLIQSFAMPSRTIRTTARMTSNKSGFTFLGGKVLTPLGGGASPLLGYGLSTLLGDGASTPLAYRVPTLLCDRASTPLEYRVLTLLGDRASPLLEY